MSLSVPKNKNPNPVFMVATLNGAAVNFPAYIINETEVETFKSKFDGTAPGLVWFPLNEVVDLRGPLNLSKLPRT